MSPKEEEILASFVQIGNKLKALLLLATDATEKLRREKGKDMTKVFCDNCKEQIEDHNQFLGLHIIVQEQSYSLVKNQDKGKDLCRYCILNEIAILDDRPTVEHKCRCA